MSSPGLKKTTLYQGPLVDKTQAPALFRKFSQGLKMKIKNASSGLMCDDIHDSEEDEDYDNQVHAIDKTSSG